MDDLNETLDKLDRLMETASKMDFSLPANKGTRELIVKEIVRLTNLANEQYKQCLPTTDEQESL